MTKVSFKSANDFKQIADREVTRQKARILNVLPSADIQHIGSTAIPGSITKGDLDINVRVKKEDFDNAVQEIKKLYDINQPENWMADFASFKDENNLSIDFGVQLTVIDSPIDDFVKLKNIIAGSPELIEKFNEMKIKFEGKDMSEYRKEKADFFQKLREMHLINYPR